MKKTETLRQEVVIPPRIYGVRRLFTIAYTQKKGAL
jgi:hypothetical protein